MMRSNVDPHSVRLRAFLYSCTATGHGLKAAVTLSLIPSCPAVRQISSGTGQGSAQHVVSEAVQLDGSAARWR